MVEAPPGAGAEGGAGRYGHLVLGLRWLPSRGWGATDSPSPSLGQGGEGYSPVRRVGETTTSCLDSKEGFNSIRIVNYLLFRFKSF